MRKHVLSALVSALVFGVSATSALAYHCPKLVAECQAVVAKVEKRDGSDMAMVAEAKQGCQQALTLHEQGDHKGSVIKAGEAIALAGEAAK